MKSIFKIVLSVMVLLLLSVKSFGQSGIWVQEPQNGTLGITWPYSRNWNRILYDSYQHKVLMELGTDACSIMTNSLWDYDDSMNNFILLGAMKEDCSRTTLSQSNPSWPGDRHTYSHMAYDTKRNGMWMGMGVDDVYKPNTQTCPDTGKQGPGSCNFFDMWFWNSSTESWTYNANFYGQQSQPKARSESEMEYDPINDRVVLYGGLSGGNVSDDTWVWNPNNYTWTKMCGSSSNGQGQPCAPGKKEGATIVWDATTRELMMFGGQAVYGPAGSVSIWYYNTATNAWTERNPSGVLPPAVRFPAAAFASRLGVLVYHAGPNQTWAYNPESNSWTHLNILGGPSYGGVTSQSSSMAYDEDHDVIVVRDFGKGNGGSADIWQLKLQ